MAKLNRESKLRDKRAEKQARKAARKLTVASDAAQAAPRSDELTDPESSSAVVAHDGSSATSSP
jgi:hypothetical protein